MSTDSLELAQCILQDMTNSAAEHLQDGWRGFDVRVGMLKGLKTATFFWPSWRLEVCTFILPDEYDGDPSIIETSDATYITAHNDIVTKSHMKDQSHNWDELERAPVVEVIDSFLEGSWTPPWRCGFCRDRINGTSKPKW